MKPSEDGTPFEVCTAVRADFAAGAEPFGVHLRAGGVL